MAKVYIISKELEDRHTSSTIMGVATNKDRANSIIKTDAKQLMSICDDPDTFASPLYTIEEHELLD